MGNRCTFFVIFRILLPLTPIILISNFREF
jgi:hypothetical protein